ncbi:unnamed protein product, partial [Iphiclides podalirius]
MAIFNFSRLLFNDANNVFSCELMQKVRIVAVYSQRVGWVSAHSAPCTGASASRGGQQRPVEPRPPNRAVVSLQTRPHVREPVDDGGPRRSRRAMLKHAQRPPAANDADQRYQNMPRRPHHHLPLNVSTLDSSKHSVGGTSASVSPGAQPAPVQAPAVPKIANGNPTGLQLRPIPLRSRSARAATEEALTSLALLCLVSLLLALLALLFLLKISAPAPAPPTSSPLCTK